MPTDTTAKGALIGCGFFAQIHLYGWQEVSGADIVAVCDTDISKAEQARTQFNSVSSAYTSARTLLEKEQLDFVDIVTTMDSHRELVEMAAEFGVPAIVQKPFAPTMADATAMVDVCYQAGIALMVHENFRWQTPLKKISELIQEGRIGQPFFSRISFRHGNPVGYESQPYLFEQDEYIIGDVGIHLFDLARLYMGEVSSIYAQKQNVNPRFNGEDVATLLLQHHSNVTSIVDLSVSTKSNPDPFPQTLVCVEGTDGTITLQEGFKLVLTCGDKTETMDVSPTNYSWAEQPWTVVQESVVNIQQHWANCLKQKREPATSGADNLKTLALSFLAYESARSNQVVLVTST